MSAKYFFAGCLLFLLAISSFCAQEKKKSEQSPSPAPAASAPAPLPSPHGVAIKAEDVARKNPVKFTQASVEQGKKVFISQCAMCHATNADGKGEAAKEMQINPPDFTKPETLKGRTDGELFAIITAGSETMPGQANRLTEKHKWQIVNFLREACGRKPVEAGKKEEEADTKEILVPK